MLLQIPKKELVHAITIVSKALSTKTAHPLLEGIFLSCEDDTLFLLCSNGALQIETSLTATVIKTGEIVLPGRLFFEIIRKLPDGLISLEQENDFTINIKCENSSISLQGFSPENYPKMQQESLENAIQIEENCLRDMIRQTIFATAQDESRPILTGILFETEENVLRLVALDGYRLAIRNEEAIINKKSQAIVPASSLNEIVKILSSASEEIVTISFSPNNMQMTWGNTKIYSVLLNGEYMKYAQIFPKDHSTVLYINRRDLLESIERTSLLARESKNNLIKFSIQEGKVVLDANSEVGFAREEIVAHTSGEMLEIAFNARYMQDVLTRLTDDEILMRFHTNITPCIIEPVSGNAYYYLVLPVRMFQR